MTIDPTGHDWTNDRHVIAAILGQLGESLEHLVQQNPDVLADYLAGRNRLLMDRYGVDVLVPEPEGEGAPS